MLKKYIREAILETQQCLAHFWEKDCRYLESRLSEQIMWIGTRQEEFIQGMEQVKTLLTETSRSIPVCQINCQEFYCIHHDKSSCAIAGRYLITAGPDTRELLQEQHRATFIWRLEKETLHLVHMHISNPIGYIEPEELFPHKIGKISYQYLQSCIDQLQVNNPTITIRNSHNQMQILAMSDIEYAEAQTHYTRIVTISETLLAKISWSEFLKLTSPYLIQTHRSYTVQKNRVRSLGRNEIILLSGKHVPVSPRRYATVYEMLSV